MTLDPEPLPSLRDTCGEKGYLAQTYRSAGPLVWTPALRVHGSTLTSAARRATTRYHYHFQSFKEALADGYALEQRPRMTLRPMC
jgi:alpha-beta hydrolase superfamily lysophospholipase